MPESALNAQEQPNTMLNLNYVFASLALAILMEPVLPAVESIKSYRMEFAAAKMDITLLEVFAVDADGTKSTTKALAFAEFLATKREFIILPQENVYAYLISLNYPTESVVPALSIQPSTQSQKPASACKAISKTLAFA